MNVHFQIALSPDMLYQEVIFLTLGILNSRSNSDDTRCHTQKYKCCEISVKPVSIYFERLNGYNKNKPCLLNSFSLLCSNTPKYRSSKTKLKRIFIYLFYFLNSLSRSRLHVTRFIYKLTNYFIWCKISAYNIFYFNVLCVVCVLSLLYISCYMTANGIYSEHCNSMH